MGAVDPLPADAVIDILNADQQSNKKENCLPSWEKPGTFNAEAPRDQRIPLAKQQQQQQVPAVSLAGVRMLSVFVTAPPLATRVHRRQKCRAQINSSPIQPEGLDFLLNVPNTPASNKYGVQIMWANMAAGWMAVFMTIALVIGMFRNFSWLLAANCLQFSIFLLTVGVTMCNAWQAGWFERVDVKWTTASDGTETITSHYFYLTTLSVWGFWVSLGLQCFCYAVVLGALVRADEAAKKNNSKPEAAPLV